MRAVIRKFVYPLFIVMSVLVTNIAVPGIAGAEYPEKPVSFIVQWAPGHVEDALTRMMAEDFTRMFDSPAAVTNKAGVGSSVMDVATMPADGYTIGSFVIGMPIDKINSDDASSYSTLDAVPDTLEPLGIFYTHPFVLVASKNSSFSTINTLTKYAMENAVAFGHAGRSLPPTKLAIAFAKNTGFEWGDEIELNRADCNALASGKVDVISTTLQQIMPCLNDINVLASITESRNPRIPNTPTLGEIDPTLVLGFWNGLFVHKDTPPDIRTKITDAAKISVTSERARALAKDGRDR